MLDVNNFDQLRIGLATAESIRSWSNGEVKKPETINYRTLRPEKDGLFCEKIFGPTKDWECYCGKYKRVRFRGIICERCGVEVTRSKVRRERMGHIELAAPVVHIWYLRGTRSWLAYLLMGTEAREELKAKQLEKVIYFAANLVTWVDDEKRHEDLPALEAELADEVTEIERQRDLDIDRRFKGLEAELAELEGSGAKDTEIKARQRNVEKEITAARARAEAEVDLAKRAFDEFRDLFSRKIIEDELLWRELRIRYEDYFEGGMGAEAIAKLIDRIDFDVEEVKLREAIDAADGRRPLSAQRRQKAIKRLKIVTSFNRRDDHGRRVNDPRAMILGVVPVIPPDLRPMVQLDGGRFATSDLNDLYRRVINRNNRLKRLLDLGAPEIIVNNEKRMLQEAVDALFDNGRRGRPVTGPGNRPLEEPLRHAQGQAGPVPPEPARQARRLLGPLGHRHRPDHVAAPVRPAQADGPRAVQAVRHEAAGRPGAGPEHQVGQAHGRAPAPAGVGRARGRHQGAPRAPQPGTHAAPPGHPGLRAGAGRGQGHPGPPARVHGLQRRLRRRPDGRPPAPVGRGAGRGPRPHAVGQQHPVAGHGPPDHRAHPGHGVRRLLPDAGGGRGQGRGAGLPPHARGRARLRRGRAPPARQDRRASAGRHLAVRGHRQGRVPRLGDPAGRRQRQRWRRRRGGRGLRRPVPLAIETTPGRLFFNEALPEGFRYVNDIVGKRNTAIGSIVEEIAATEPKHTVASSLDRIKALGFRYASQSGLTISIDDVRTPPEKREILERYEREAEKAESQYKRGIITDDERRQKEVEIWTSANSDVGRAMEKTLSELKFNPIDMMVDSGARGNAQQIRQIAGMKGLVSNPRGEMIPRPIKSSFREGLSVLEYFISTHGTRKGLADTALRTADSGLPHPPARRRRPGAHRPRGRLRHHPGHLARGDHPRRPRARARTSRPASTAASSPRTCPWPTAPRWRRAPILDDELVAALRDDPGVDRVRVRSVLTCESEHGVCATCYGQSLATGRAHRARRGGRRHRRPVHRRAGHAADHADVPHRRRRRARTSPTACPASSSSSRPAPRRAPRCWRDHSGVVRIEDEEGGRRITVVADDGDRAVRARVRRVPTSSVARRAEVDAGDALVEGPKDPKELLDVKGIRETQQYLVEEVQKVYRDQGVSIHDKHIELIVRQMLRRVLVAEPGDSAFLPGRAGRRPALRRGQPGPGPRGQAPRRGPSGAHGDHQGVARHGLAGCRPPPSRRRPGCSPRRPSRAAGPPARPQGEHHHRQADPGRARAWSATARSSASRRRACLRLAARQATETSAWLRDVGRTGATRTPTSTALGCRRLGDRPGGFGPTSRAAASAPSPAVGEALGRAEDRRSDPTSRSRRALGRDAPTTAGRLDACPGTAVATLDCPCAGALGARGLPAVAATPRGSACPPSSSWSARAGRPRRPRPRPPP